MYREIQHVNKESGHYRCRLGRVNSAVSCSSRHVLQRWPCGPAVTESSTEPDRGKQLFSAVVRDASLGRPIASQDKITAEGAKGDAEALVDLLVPEPESAANGTFTKGDMQRLHLRTRNLPVRLGCRPGSCETECVLVHLVQVGSQEKLGTISALQPVGE